MNGALPPLPPNAMNNDLKNTIAPPSIVITPRELRIGAKYARTIFISNYPRYLSTGWFSPLVNAPEIMDISIFMHPLDTGEALKKLKKKTIQIQAQIMEHEEKGLVRNPMLETAFQDVEGLRDALQQARERLFTVSAYCTFYADTIPELNALEARIMNILETRLVYAKQATFEQVEGWNSTLPIAQDYLNIGTPLNSGPAASFFPFISTDLTATEGILYGVNSHNNTLVIFDRFSLENANMVIFSKSGAGKSYAAKLEALRLLMTGTDVIIIDPEHEYKALADAAGGSFINISLASPNRINPFDIPIAPENESPDDVLKSHIVTLAGLIKIMVGKITPEDEAVLDRAITETYALHDIVPGKDWSKRAPPLLSDLEAVLRNLDGGKSIADRLYRFTKGSYAGFTNLPTNIDLANRLIVFSIRDLENELRPVAMYLILNFIWNIIKSNLKKRVMIVDEAWWLMQYPEGALFLFGLVKRARKYFLGVTTITQDVEDFLLSPYGRPIITNSSLQILLKQSPAMIDIVEKTFNLSPGEKNFLLETPVGEGLFFAGLKRAVMRVLASPFEDRVITTKPEELLEQQNNGTEP